MRWNVIHGACYVLRVTCCVSSGIRSSAHRLLCYGKTTKRQQRFDGSVTLARHFDKHVIELGSARRWRGLSKREETTDVGTSHGANDGQASDGKESRVSCTQAIHHKNSITQVVKG